MSKYSFQFRVLKRLNVWSYIVNYGTITIDLYKSSKFEPCTGFLSTFAILQKCLNYVYLDEFATFQYNFYRTKI